MRGETDRLGSQLLERFRASYAPLLDHNDQKQHFHGLYLRNTVSVLAELDRGGFIDPGWVTRWDVAFAGLYLDALELWQAGGSPARPWQLAFEAARDPRIPPLRHELAGLNAHLNYDLPRSVLAVTPDEEFGEPAVVARRHADFRHIDDIVVRRVPSEYRHLRAAEAPDQRTVFDRALYPLNLFATRRWLTEARRKVWNNAEQLNVARRQGPEALAVRLEQLETLSAAKVVELLAPGQVLLRLAVRGFGVVLPPAPHG